MPCGSESCSKTDCDYGEYFAWDVVFVFPCGLLWVSFVEVWDYIKGLFDAPFSSTVNGLSIVGLSIAGFLALWLLCGFLGALRDIFADLAKKLASKLRRTETGGNEEN